MSIQLILAGDLLIVGEGTSDLGSVEAAVIYGAWIICHEPFPRDNREIGYEAMRQMLEEDRPWDLPAGGYGLGGTWGPPSP